MSQIKIGHVCLSLRGVELLGSHWTNTHEM